jgi:hypothetical protein
VIRDGNFLHIWEPVESAAAVRRDENKVPFWFLENQDLFPVGIDARTVFGIVNRNRHDWHIEYQHRQAGEK